MNKIDVSSVIISLFKRKGAEGIFTHIINNSDIDNYDGVSSHILEGEIGLIICYKTNSEWWLLTDKRVIFTDKENCSYMLNSEISEVKMALHEEYKNGIMDKEKFTKISATDINNNNYIWTIESGKPYQGIYQVLHFILQRNGYE